MTLNGVTCLAIVAGVVIALITSLTVLVVTGNTVPDVLTTSIAVLIGAIGGGGIVNRVNAGAVATAQATAAAATEVKGTG